MQGAASGPIVLVGAGNMGGAMLRGWLDAGIPGRDVIVVDPGPSPAMMQAMTSAGVRHETVAPPDMLAGILFLAIKPQMMATVVPSLKNLVGPDTVVVSVAAGTTIASLAGLTGCAAVVRAMPNTPAMVGRGITGTFASAEVSEEARRRVEMLLKVSGPVEWVEKESLIDAVTAVSGSGPAYVFFLVECMAEAGRQAGLPADLAMRLARATVSGAGEMLHRSSDPADVLRKNVTSPGGTTSAALSVLMADDGMKPLLERAVAAAARRAGELAG